MIFVNPGTGPLENASEAKATENIAQFCYDIMDGIAYERAPEEDSEGRFGYRLTLEGRSCVVEMPGIDTDKVRWLDKPGQNIWDFPRLYVDGSSWVWGFAVGMAGDKLTGRN